MAKAHPIEVELVKLTKLKGKYDDRQEFFAALLRALQKVKDDDYDNLSDEAANWHTRAVEEFSAGSDVSEFNIPADGSAEAEEPEDVEDEIEEAEDESEADEAEDEAEEPDESEDEAEEPEDEAEDEEPVKPAKKAAKKTAPVKAKKKVEPEPEDDDESESEDEEAEDEKPAPKSKKAAQPKKKVRTKIDTERYDKITGEKDKFGVIKGTKTAQAVEMYEKGATAGEIFEALEGRYYNILKKLQGDGHRLEKLAGGKWKLTHKDDIKKPSKKT